MEFGKKQAWTAALILMLAGGLDPVSAQSHYKDLQYPPLNPIHVPQVERIELENGMILYLVEDHELPTVRISARIGVGSIYEPPEKVGLAAITGAVMRTGGTHKMSGDEMDELLEGIAASVETGIGRTSGSAFMSVLKEDLDTGLSVLADVLMNPAFPEEKIELQRVQARSAIARQNDDVTGIALREFNQLIYGSQSMYARQSEYETIDAITRNDLIAFHKEYFHPDNVMLGAWGDFQKDELVEKIKDVFKDWKKVGFQRAPTPPVPYEFDRSVNFIPKEDVNQSTILIGHIGGLRNNPDYFALRVNNLILSAAFIGRLFRHIRSDQGLAYAVLGRYSANFDYPGTFYVGCITKSETTVKAIRSLLHEVEMIRKEEVTDQELALAQESFLNAFVFNFDTRRELVGRLMTYEYYGYPKDFLQKTKEGIEKTTKADVLRVAQEYLKPGQVRILVVGNDQDFDEPLSVLGDVNEIDISIPTPQEEVSEATQETLARGEDLIDRAITASGGPAAFHAVNTLRWKGTMSVTTPQGEMAMDLDFFVAYPDRMRLDTSAPMGQMSQILNGDQAWGVAPGVSRPAPPQQVQEMKENLWHNIVYLFKHADQQGLTAQYLGGEEVDGQKCEVILITPPGMKGFKLFLNSETMMPAQMQYQAMSPSGAPASTVTSLSDFRGVEGMILPFKSVVSQDGKEVQEITINEILVNPEIDESQFR